jgi:transaldolase
MRSCRRPWPGWSPNHESSGGADGRVSVEVDPRLAHDTAAMVTEAWALWWRVDRPNLLIKIPAASMSP